MSISASLNFSGRHKLPVVLQTEAAECGLACLAMVSSFYGHRIDLATLRGKHSISLRGATLVELVKIAAHLDLQTRAVKADLDQLAKLTLPAVLHWDFNHFVVLTEFKWDRIMVHDPARGVRKLTMSEFSKHYTGVALELWPSQKFTAKDERQKIRIGRLFGKIHGIGATITKIFLLAGALEVFAIISPFFMQLVVDSAIVSEDRDLLTVLGTGFLLLALIQVLITGFRSWVVMVLGTTLNLRLLSNLFNHLLRLPINYFEKRHLGDVVSRFESVNVIQRTLTTSFLEAIIDGVMVMVTFVMMVIYSWKLSLIVLIAGVLYAILRFSLYQPLLQASEEQILHSAKQQSSFLETVRGIQSVKLFNRQYHRSNLFQNLAVDNFNAGINIQKLNILYKSLNGSIFGIENIGVIWIGALQVLDGGFSVGMLFAFIAYKQQFASRIISLIEKSIEFRMLGLHTNRVADIVTTEPESCRLIDTVNDLSGCLDIEVNALGFRYSDSDPMVFENLNFTINEGESVAIVGSSGCGKTTLVKVMLGLLTATQGDILIGGHKISQLSQFQFRELVGTVMQEDQLFAGSLADNISFFDEQTDLARIEECGRLASIHEDISAMPMGYNTLVGDMGTILSGGQKQRVLLARALYKKPKILILDEATSHLDVNNEKLVNEAVKQLKLTRIIIAHRPETIATVDRVITMQPYAPNPIESKLKERNVCT